MGKNHNPMIGYPYQAPFSAISSICCTFIICYSLMCKKSLFDNKDTKIVIILLIFYDGLCLASLIPVFKYSTNNNSINSKCIVTSDPDMKDNMDVLCNFQGFLIQFFSLSGILWTGIINYQNYKRISTEKNSTYSMNIKFPLSAILLFSFITSALAFAHVGYQESTCWCWFNITKSNSDLDHVKRFFWIGFFYAISWAVIIFIGYAFIATLKKYIQSGANKNSYKETYFIPIILLICFIPLTISRGIAISGLSNCSLVGFSIFSSCLMRCLGFFNCLVYGYQTRFWKHIPKNDEPYIDNTPEESREFKEKNCEILANSGIEDSK